MHTGTNEKMLKNDNILPHAIEIYHADLLL